MIPAEEMHLLAAGLLAAAVLLPAAYLAYRRLAAGGRGAASVPPAAGRREAAGDLGQAAALHLRAGAPLRAAGLLLRKGKHREAAEIYRREGDHLRAGQALEGGGDAAAAAREYSAAGHHARAARLLEALGRYAEAAAAYRPILDDAAVTPHNAALHTTHAALLALAGDRDRAADAYRRVLAAVPGHLRAASGLQSLLTRAPSRPLRGIICAGRLEPRASLKLWVQAMRALEERHRGNAVFGCLTPESISLDQEGRVRIEASADRRAPYAAPEVLAGLPPDRQADIHSMGVILFELLTGGTGQFGRRGAAELFPDVPPWLDELIERCTDPDPAQRYGTTEEVSAALLKRKKAAAE